MAASHPHRAVGALLHQVPSTHSALTPSSIKQRQWWQKVALRGRRPPAFLEGTRLAGCMEAPTLAQPSSARLPCPPATAALWLSQDWAENCPHA